MKLLCWKTILQQSNIYAKGRLPKRYGAKQSFRFLTQHKFNSISVWFEGSYIYLGQRHGVIPPISPSWDISLLTISFKNHLGQYLLAWVALHCQPLHHQQSTQRSKILFLHTLIVWRGVITEYLIYCELTITKERQERLNGLMLISEPVHFWSGPAAWQGVQASGAPYASFFKGIQSFGILSCPVKNFCLL